MDILSNATRLAASTINTKRKNSNQNTPNTSKRFKQTNLLQFPKPVAPNIPITPPNTVTKSTQNQSLFRNPLVSITNAQDLTSLTGGLVVSKQAFQQNLEEETDIVNGVQLSILGKKYKPKLIQTKQYPNGPDPKVCPICNSSMDWRTSGTIMGRKNKSGVLTHYTYGIAHSGAIVPKKLTVTRIP